MKKAIFLGILFSLFTLSAQAQWQVQNFRGAQAPVGLQSFSVIEKVKKTRAGSFTTGVITNSVVKTSDLKKLKSQPQTPKAMAEQIREALKAPAWEHQSLEGLEFFTMKWKEENRLLRLVIQQDSKFVRISFANLRRPYALIESVEADFLQRAFFKWEQRKSKAAGLWPSLWNVFAPEAQALNLSVTQMQDAYRGFLQSSDQLARNVGYNSALELSRSINNLSTSVQTTDANLSGSINNLSDAARNTFTWMNGVKFGAGMGVGFTAASAATNFIIDGSAKMVRELYYFALGKMKPEEKAALESRVGKAFDQLVQQSEKVAQLQKDLAMYEMAYSSAFLLPAGFMIDSVESADSARIDLEDQLKTMRDKLAKTTDPEQRRLCVKSIYDLEGQLAKVSAMKAVLSEVGGKDKLCGRLTDLLDDWTVAEASLHRASRVISSEMTTVLGQIQSEEIAALEDPVSKRKKVNECEARGKKLASRNRELYKEKNCDSTPQDPDCAEFKYQIELFEKAVGECESQFNRSEEAQSTRSLAKGAELTNQQIAVAKKRLEKIAAADCRAGETSANCKGEVGDVEQLRQIYQAKADTYRRACPQYAPAAPVVNFSRESYTSGFVDEKKDLKPESRSPQSEKAEKPESKGLFDKIFGFFRKLFS